MMSVKFSSDIHYLTTLTPVIVGGKTRYIRKDMIHCEGEENTIERTSKVPYDVTCFLCRQVLDG